MNSNYQTNEEHRVDFISPYSPYPNSIDLESETLTIENSHDQSQFTFHPIISDPYPGVFENIDIGNIEEENTNYECSEMSSAANSQSRQGNIHEGQIFGNIDLTPSALDRKRRRGLDNLILSKFFTKRTRKIPKKEYIRLRIIRGHKKANRQIIKNQMPLVKALHSFEPKNTKSSLIWRVLTAACSKAISTISQSCRTESGPATDGKSRKTTISSSEARSFNNTFCRDYFSIPGILESYFWYIELIFANKNPNVLCQKFEIDCCDGQHTRECENKWQILHAYLNDIMIRDLEMSPWFPNGYNQRNITLEDLVQSENERIGQEVGNGEDAILQYTL